MATEVNPTPKTGTTKADTVKVRWTGATKLRGVRQERTIGKHTWASDGWDEGPVVEMDAAAWAELTPEQRKADGFEEA